MLGSLLLSSFEMLTTATSMAHWIAGRQRRRRRDQRPEPVTKYGYFLDHMFLDRPPIRYNYLAFVLNDGTEKPVSIMLDQAMEAWSRELTRLEL